MFLNDQETAIDLLYYEAVAKTVVRLIRATPATPVTVGVHGDWGAGKSSVLKMTSAALEEDDKALCLWFNGWTFEGFEDAKTVVIETIVEELRQARPHSTKVADAARKVLKRVDWLKVAKKAGGFAFTAMTGVPTFDQLEGLVARAKSLLANPQDAVSAQQLKAFAEQAGECIKERGDEADHLPHQMHKFREEFNELIAAAEIHQLVVIVDDLDRCLPATAIATLEAIRLFLFVPRTAFVIGADEQMIEYAVREHFPDLPPALGPVPYARNYLEKLIQVPFRIPALGLAETRIYVTLLQVEAALGPDDPRFKKLLDGAREELRRPWLSRGLDAASVAKILGTAVTPQISHAVEISTQISKILTEGTRGNPRQIKRFLNSMALRYAIAEARGFAQEIQPPVLAKIMLAESFAPDLYGQLARLAVASSDGKVKALAQLEQAMKGEQSTAETKPGRPDKKQEAAAAAASPAAELEEWSRSDWINGWAAIEPGLGDVDLRPYVFATRDKRSYLGGLATAAHLEGPARPSDRSPPLRARHGRRGGKTHRRGGRGGVRWTARDDPRQRGSHPRTQGHARAHPAHRTARRPAAQTPCIPQRAAAAQTWRLGREQFHQRPDGTCRGRGIQGTAAVLGHPGGQRQVEDGRDERVEAGGDRLMGTSKSYGGPGSGLVPSWADDPAPPATPPAGATPPVAPGQPAAPANPPGSPASPPSQPAQPDTAGTGAYSGAKRKFSAFARNGSASSLGGAMRRYVRSSGGPAKAARRMGAARAAGGRLLGFVRDAERVGVAEALRSRGLQNLAGQPAEDVFRGLVDIVCPPGGPIDEAISRQAMLDAMGDQVEAGVTDFGALSPDQLKEFFLDYVIRSIEGRVMSDIAARAVSLPDDVEQVMEIQQQLHDFIAGCTRSHLGGQLTSLSALTDQQIEARVSSVYEAAFDLVAAAGEAAE